MSKTFNKSVKLAKERCKGQSIIKVREELEMILYIELATTYDKRKYWASSFETGKR